MEIVSRAFASQLLGDETDSLNSRWTGKATHLTGGEQIRLAEMCDFAVVVNLNWGMAKRTRSTSAEKLQQLRTSRHVLQTGTLEHTPTLACPRSTLRALFPWSHRRLGARPTCAEQREQAAR